MILGGGRQRALVLAPHTDDGEFGCGGTIARLIDEGHEVHYVAYSSCRESVPEGFPPDVLVGELKAATGELGVSGERLRLHEYPVRRYLEHRQDILETMVALRRELAPTLVLLPSPDDVHQDHQVIAQEGLRAFRGSSLLCYEMPWNHLRFQTLAFVRLEESHLDRKLRALAHYESQKHRPYASEEFVTSLGRVRGVSIGAAYAEAFEVLRLIA